MLIGWGDKKYTPNFTGEYLFENGHLDIRDNKRMT